MKKKRQKKFDLIVPIYNAPHHARKCLESIKRYATKPYHIFIVNDASDEYTTWMLRELLRWFDSESYTLIEHSENQGYLKSVNEAIEKGKGDYVVLINSDTMIFEGTIERLEKDFQSAKDIGIINPTSTWANWTRIPFPEALDIFSLQKIVRSLGEDDLADIYNASGFFFAAKREVYEKIGLFDPIYEKGYWEEADFCMRALESGYRVVVDRSLYVFHSGWGSFGTSGRNHYMEKNKGIFMERWRKQYRQYEELWRQQNPIRNLFKKLEIESRALLEEAQYDISFIAFQDAVSEEEFESLTQLVNHLLLQDIHVRVFLVKRDRISREGDADLSRKLPIYFRPWSCSESDLNILSFSQDEAVVVFGGLDIFGWVRNLSNLRDEMVLFWVSGHSIKTISASNAVSLSGERNMVIGYGSEAHRNTSLIFSHSFGIPLSYDENIFYNCDSGQRNKVLFFFNSKMTPSEMERVEDIAREIAKKNSEFSIERVTLDTRLERANTKRINTFEEMAKTLRSSLMTCDFFEFSGNPSHIGIWSLACGSVPFLHVRSNHGNIVRHEHTGFLFHESMPVREVVDQIGNIIKNESHRKTIIQQGSGLLTKRSFSYQSKRLLELLTVQSGKIVENHTIEEGGARDKGGTHEKRRGVIYTCITGGYDELRNHEYMNPEWDYVCFTDEPSIRTDFNSKWEIRGLQHDENDEVRNQRWHKLHPHVILPEYEVSLWVDGNVDIFSEEFFSDIEKVVERGGLISVSKHPDRECLYDELEACVALGKDDEEIMRGQVDMIRRDGFPEGRGLFETNILLRRHNDEKVKKIMGEWWWWIENHSRRDQLSLTYVLWKNDFHADVLSDVSYRRQASVRFVKNRNHVTKEELRKRCDDFRAQVKEMSVSVSSLRSALKDSEQELRMIKDSKFWKLRDLYMKLKGK